MHDQKVPHIRLAALARGACHDIIRARTYVAVVGWEQGIHGPRRAVRAPFNLEQDVNGDEGVLYSVW